MNTVRTGACGALCVLASAASAAAAEPRMPCGDLPPGSVVRLTASQQIGCGNASVIAQKLNADVGRRFPGALPARFSKTFEIDRERGTSGYDRFACRNRASHPRAPGEAHTYLRQEVTCVNRKGGSLRVVLAAA